MGYYSGKSMFEEKINQIAKNKLKFCTLNKRLVYQIIYSDFFFKIKIFTLILLINGTL